MAGCFVIVPIGPSLGALLKALGAKLLCADKSINDGAIRMERALHMSQAIRMLYSCQGGES